eukprot:9504941-Karenia_brevis.AAC.1
MLLLLLSGPCLTRLPAYQPCCPRWLLRACLNPSSLGPPACSASRAPPLVAAVAALSPCPMW